MPTTAMSGAISGSGVIANVITKLKNALPSSDETARPAFPGEHHAILQLPNGKPGIANYVGPGTNIMARIKRGDPPRTLTDKVAQAHDIRYGLAHNQEDISKADRKMVESLKKLQIHKTDRRINTEIGLRPIQAKIFAEDKKLVRPGVIAEIGGINEPRSRMLLKTRLGMLEQEGYGEEERPLPGQELREKVMRQMRRKKMKGSGTTTATRQPDGSLMYGGSATVTRRYGNLTIQGAGFKETVKKIYSKGVKISNSAAKLYHVGEKIHKFVTKHQLPRLFAEMSGMGLKLAGQGIIGASSHRIQKIIMDELRNQPLTGTGKFSAAISKLWNSAKPMAGKIGKLMLPIVIGILKEKVGAHMAGSGMRPEAFADFKKRVENPGVLAKLGDKLGSALWSGLKKYISAKFGTKTTGSGLSLAGGSFKGFIDGLKRAFGTVGSIAKVVAPILPLLL